MTTKELEPCPFCSDGGKPKMHRYLTYIESCLRDKFYVTCDQCGADQTGGCFTEQEAAEKWNTRYKRTCHFIYEKDEYPVHFGKWECTSCGKWWMYPPFDLDNINFCPSCGAEVVNDN